MPGQGGSPVQTAAPPHDPQEASGGKEKADSIEKGADGRGSRESPSPRTPPSDRGFSKIGVDGSITELICRVREVVREELRSARGADPQAAAPADRQESRRSSGSGGPSWDEGD